jgi:hypothetical protein
MRDHVDHALDGFAPASRALNASEGRSDLLHIFGLEKVGAHQTAEDAHADKHEAIAVVLLLRFRFVIDGVAPPPSR